MPVYPYPDPYVPADFQTPPPASGHGTILVFLPSLERVLPLSAELLQRLVAGAGKLRICAAADTSAGGSARGLRIEIQWIMTTQRTLRRFHLQFN